MQDQFKMLFQPIQIGPLKLNNRMVRESMWSRTTSADGEVTHNSSTCIRALQRAGHP
jgi:2,4-dienoyl-CoA reductase-like NADH-dependent reductase (Old Yellow Enzyme family)